MIAKIIIQVGIACGLIAAAMNLGGCAVFNPSGFEFGAKAGMYAVDERHDESRTNANRKPMLCSLWGSLAMCSQNKGGEVHGS